MERTERKVGIAVLLGLLAITFAYLFTAMSGIDEESDNRPGAVKEREEPSDEAEARSVPSVLAFADGFPSGPYRVADQAWSRGDRHSLGRSEEPIDSIMGGEVASAYDAQNMDDFDEIQPGLYSTRFDIEDCEYELRRILEDRSEHIIGHDRLSRGRMLVTIHELEPDTFLANEDCGTWAEWAPLSEPLTSAGDGDYWTGDLAQGMWSVPTGCFWEKVVAFRGARLLDVVETGSGGTRDLAVDEGTIGVRIRGCGTYTLTRVGDAPPYVPPIDFRANPAEEVDENGRELKEK